MGEVIYKPEDASKGGYNSIVKIEGMLTSVETIAGKRPSTFNNVVYDQAQIVLDDAIILEMLPDEEEPELKDNRFTIWMNYGRPGQKPTQGSFFTRGFLTSAKELAKERGHEDPSLKDLIGTRVTLEFKKDFHLFTRTTKEGKEEEFKGNGWVFVLGAGSSKGFSIEDHVKKLIVGKNKPNALRELVGDTKVKQDPKWKEYLNQGTIAEMLGLEVVDGIYREKTATKVA